MVYLGIYGGLLFGIAGWYFGRRAAAKKNGLDEMHDFIAAKSRSISWYFTIAAIYVLLSMEAFGLSIGTMPSLGTLLFVHLGSWAAANTILTVRMTTEAEEAGVNKLRLVISIWIGTSVIVAFAILSAITEEWRFLLAAVPPVILTNISMLLIEKKSDSTKKN